MITTNQQWLYASLFIYFMLFIGLGLAVVFNYIHIYPSIELDCPNVNECPECPTIPCTELIKILLVHVSHQVMRICDQLIH